MEVSITCFFDSSYKNKMLIHIEIAIGRQILLSVIQEVLLRSIITAVSQVSLTILRIQTEKESNATNVKDN